MISLTLESDRLLVEQGSEPSQNLTLRLNALRKVFLFMPPDYDWYAAEATMDRNAVNLDDLSAEQYADLLARLAGLDAGRDKFDLLLEDYLGRCIVLSLADVDASGLDLLTLLGEYREVRRQRAIDWTRHGPGLIITGALGDQATMGPHGVRCSHADPYMPWEELDRVEIRADRNAGLDVYRFVPKPGTPSQELTVRMPSEKAQSFVAEYIFWHSRALRQAAGLEPGNV